MKFQDMPSELSLSPKTPLCLYLCNVTRPVKFIKTENKGLEKGEMNYLLLIGILFGLVKILSWMNVIVLK